MIVAMLAPVDDDIIRTRLEVVGQRCIFVDGQRRRSEDGEVHRQYDLADDYSRELLVLLPEYDDNVRDS